MGNNDDSEDQVRLVVCWILLYLAWLVWLNFCFWLLGQTW